MMKRVETTRKPSASVSKYKQMQNSLLKPISFEYNETAYEAAAHKDAPILSYNLVNVPAYPPLQRKEDEELQWKPSSSCPECEETEIQAKSSTTQRQANSDFEEREALKGTIYPQSLATSEQANRSAGSSIDMLSNEGESPDGPYIDQPHVPASAPSPAPSAAPAPPAPPVLARPTSLLQLLTGWTPGPDRYGFQLFFRCRSTSGDVQDLQNQAPNLIWREHVTYTRNDFAHRINPPNPTILPAGGVPFAAASTTRQGRNLLEFNNVTDTHWMPTTAILAADFQPAGSRPLPAVMESRQTYQFSPDGGSTWRYFAGSFIIRRTLFRTGGGLRFSTQKTGVHTIDEAYKP